ncbi:MAG: PA0069 family radical SAM protein [Planctomycetes bacterium]|nr:PA0069 family radical SAM protein [Planctomycetota bacterium]
MTDDPFQPDHQHPDQYQDALIGGPAHRRGAGLNPANRFEDIRLHVLGEEIDRDLVEREDDEGKLRRVERRIYQDRTQTIINRVTSTSDVPFDWTLNPYRGCEHGCIYCFARPYHEYLGFSCGLDFETKLIAKPDAAALLRRELSSRRWKPETIVMSAITDIYQPIEHKLRIACQCLEVLAECHQPVTTMTKSALVLRDIDLWSRLAEKNAGSVTITIVTLDPELARAIEPRASAPSARLRAIQQLTAAGIPVNVNIAPVIPGLTDSEMPAIIEAAAAAAARRASWVLLRLPYQLKDLFLDWMRRTLHPDRARKVESLMRQLRGGKLDDANHNRGRGDGPYARNLKQTFDIFTHKYHMNLNIRPLTGQHFRAPNAEPTLF